MIVRGRNNRTVTMTIKSQPEGVFKAAIELTGKQIGADPATDTSVIVLNGKNWTFADPAFGTVSTYAWAVTNIGEGYNGGDAVASGDDGEIFTVNNIQPSDDFIVTLTVTTTNADVLTSAITFGSSATGYDLYIVNAHIEDLNKVRKFTDASSIVENSGGGGIVALNEIGVDVGPTGTYDSTSTPPSVNHDFVAAGTYVCDYSVTDSDTAIPLGGPGKVGFKIIVS